MNCIHAPKEQTPFRFSCDNRAPKIPGAISLNIVFTGALVQINKPPTDVAKKIIPIII